MNILEALKSRAGTVVLVDNEFAPRKVQDINAEDRTAFYQHLETSPEAKLRVAELLRVDSAMPSSDMLMAADEQATTLWEQFLANPTTNADLEILFRTEFANYRGDRLKLDIIIAFCRESLGVEPAIFHDLAAARDTLSACMVAFVDLYLQSGTDNLQGAIAEHSQHVGAYRSPFTHGEGVWPKIVFLVSSKLPEPEHLQAFRDVTGIRSAFFAGIRKGDVSMESLQATLQPWGSKYGPAAKLNNYLNALGGSLKDAGQAVAREVDRLELHDLSTLEVLRLSAENESLQGYLTWILSESLASKFRAGKQLQSDLLPAPAEVPPVDGQLLPQSVLFELFSEIAVSPAGGATSSAEFGDIYEALPAPPGEARRLLLAISPACDLVRCPPDYDVLCVRGVIANADSNLASLLTKVALYGKGNLVVRFQGPDGSRYAHITWSVSKGLVTRTASDLGKPDKFRKIGRLSEIFAQEIKTLALSDAARVGTPVEPTFAVAARVQLRARFMPPRTQENPKPEAVELGADLKDEPHFCALLTKGRVSREESKTQEVLVLTSQFNSWLQRVFIPQLRGGRGPLTKLQTIEESITGRSLWTVPLKNRASTELDGSLHYRVIEGEELPDPPKGDYLQIIVSISS